MIRHKPLLVFMLAALVCSFAGEANAERLYSRVSQGNNVGFYLYADWGGPMNWAGGRAAQFPRGSGNLITNDGWQFPICTVRDLNGDGIPEDTAATGDGGRAFMPYYSSIWAEEVLADLYAAYRAGGLNVETATNGMRAGNGISQIWSSLDPDCIATWPREARKNFEPNGDPVIIGSETLFGHFGDSFNTWTENNGFYMGLSFYFTDFGEANNMCFGRGIIHQVTHYVKYRPDPQPAKYQTAKEGWEWVDMTIMLNQRMTSMAGLRARWSFHPEREIGALWRDGTIASFSPPEPPVIAFRMIEKPKFKGQEMNLTNYWTYSGGFGMTGTGYLTNLAFPRQYLATRGEYDAYPGKINPFTGEGNMMGYPGMLKPTDERFGQWLWGPTTEQNNTCWSSLRGMMPRDTTSFDFVLMFVPAEGRQIVPPQTNLDNIDDPVMQQAFARVLDYDVVAQEMYDINLMGPQTPVPPPLTIIPGDREVTITWSDINVKTPDAFLAIPHFLLKLQRELILPEVSSSSP